MSSQGPLLEIREMTKAFGSNVALAGVSFEVSRGESLGIIGPNGCGKSTLINCLSGVLHPSFGQVQYAGVDVTRWSIHRRTRAGLVRTYQNLRLFPRMSVLENVVARVGSAARDPLQVMDEMGLASIQHDVVHRLSYGHQRRTELARALVVTPRVLLLDEPAAGLDTTERQRLAAVLRDRSAKGVGVVLVDHDMSLITAVCSRILVLDRGKVVFVGAPQDALNDPHVVDIYLGKPLEGKA